MKRFIAIGLIFFGLCSCTKDNELLDEIYDEPGYAIGKVNTSITASFSARFNYEYTVSNTVYKGNKTLHGIGNKDGKVGRQFLVVYKRSDPAKSDINFRYLITSEQYFLDLLERFKDNPPKR
jgi:hypothetical protein